MRAQPHALLRLLRLLLLRLLLLLPRPLRLPDGCRCCCQCAHRCVLAVGSPFFKGLYTGGIPLKKGPYSLEQVSVVTFEAVLTWLYTGSCKLVTQDGLVPLLEAADLLGVLSLRDAVVAAIIERLTPDLSLIHI